MSVRTDITGSLTRLTEIQQRTMYACMAYGRAAANRLVKEAKRTRPWTDRTHLAKNSLNGGATQQGSRVRVELAHGVHYGTYLELRRFRHKGNLAVVFPTVKRMAPEIIRGWAQTVRKGGA